MAVQALPRAPRCEMHNRGQSISGFTILGACGGAPARPARPIPATYARRKQGFRGTHGSTACCRPHASTPMASSSDSAGSSPSTAVAVSQYLGKGPYTASLQPPLTFGVGQGRSGPLDCTVRVSLPQGGPAGRSPSGGQRWPLVVLSSGFLLHSGMYGSYAADLASWGLAVALYDLPEVVDDTTMVSAIGSILDVCTRDPRVSPHIDPRAILLAGHSRGGKLSALAAASDPRVKGIALLDPVDVTAMTPMGPGYPSALPAMRTACGPPRRVPALVIGAARNASVVPAYANYKRFVSSCPGACWSLELLGAGHLQFLDSKVDLFASFVESGPATDEAVRRGSKLALLAWALELAVPLARGEAPSGPQVLDRLQQAASLIRKQTDVVCGLNGFDYLGTSAAASGSGTGGAGGGAAGAGSRGTRSGAATASASASSSSSSQPEAGGSGSGRSTGGPGTAPGPASSSDGTRASQPAGGSGARGGGWSYEALLAMRARELKAILVERGIDCSDCFEKEDLARRIMERCS